MLSRLGLSRLAFTAASPFRRSLAAPSFTQVASYIIPSRTENVVNVYKALPRLITRGSSPLLEAREDLYMKYDPDGSKRLLFNQSNESRMRPGDVVQVTKKDGYSFVGVVIAINKRHLSTNIVLRTKISGVGVENRVSVFNPAVTKLEVLRVPAKRWKRSKLYFIRENSKLDVGDVDAEIRKAERRRI